MSGLDSTTVLSIAELVIYLLLTPTVLYILVRHGKPGYLGWGFLIVFCGLRLASDGIQISHHKNAATAGSTSSSGAVINSIGLSGLLYSLSDIIRECSHRIPHYNHKVTFIIQLVLHLLISTGIALAAIGGSNLAKPETPQNSHATDKVLRKAGSLTLLLSAVLLILYAYHTLRSLRSVPAASRSLNAMRLLYSVMLALPFVTIRAVYGVLYSFDSAPTVNPITGVFAVKFLLIFLVQLLAMLFLVVGGIMTRSICTEDTTILSGSQHQPASSGGEPRCGYHSQELTMNEYGVPREHRDKGLQPADRGQV